MERRKCNHCSSTFIVRTRMQVYCTKQCRFNHHYHRRMKGGGPKPCVYCGAPADTTDHVPPRAYRKFLEETGNRKWPFLEVAACRECNSFLGAKALWSLTARKKACKEHIQHKYAEYLNTPPWSEAEREELGPNLDSEVGAAEAIKHVAQQRLAW